MKHWLLKTEPEDWSWKDQLNSKNQMQSGMALGIIKRQII